jgi:hypothetical protein
MIFCWCLEGHLRKEQDPEADTDLNPDPLVNTDPRIRIRTKMSRILNTGKNLRIPHWYRVLHKFEIKYIFYKNIYKICFAFSFGMKYPELSCLH